MPQNTWAIMKVSVGLGWTLAMRSPPETTPEWTRFFKLSPESWWRNDKRSSMRDFMALIAAEIRMLNAEQIETGLTPRTKVTRRGGVVSHDNTTTCFGGEEINGAS